MRLFVAVWPPDDLLARIAALDRPAVPGLRWTPRPQWHVTLRFLGEVADPDEAVAAVASVRASVVTATAGPETARFGQRILHLPVGGLEPVARAVVDATAAVGEPPEDRAFTGHITLGRVRPRARVDLRPLCGTPVAGEWDVAEVALVASRLRPQGAEYETVAVHPLEPAP